MKDEDKSRSPREWWRVDEQRDVQGKPTVLARAVKAIAEQGCGCAYVDAEPEDQCVSHLTEAALSELRKLGNELINAIAMDVPLNKDHWEHLCLLCGRLEQQGLWMVPKDHSLRWYNSWTCQAPLTLAELRIGTPVMYYPVRSGRGYRCTVETEPWQLGHGAWVCHVRDLEPAYQRDISDRTRVRAVAPEALARVADPAAHG